jgi:hypothetical protein
MISRFCLGKILIAHLTLFTTTSCISREWNSTSLQATETPGHGLLTLADGTLIRTLKHFSTSEDQYKAVDELKPTPYSSQIEIQAQSLFQGDSPADVKRLPVGDLKALLFYTNNGSSRMARALWGDLKALSEFKFLLMGTISCLNRLPATPGKSFHGRRSSPEELKSQWKVGNVFVSPNFISSSQEMRVAEKFSAGTHRGDDEKIRTILIIEGKSGRDISAVSRFKSEKEVLFQPATRFAIEKIQLLNPDKPKQEQQLNVYVRED